MPMGAMKVALCFSLASIIIVNTSSAAMGLSAVIVSRKGVK